MGLVEISQSQGRVPVTVFHLKDRVNLGNYTELEESAKSAYAGGMRDLVIDLSQVPSMTSMGIRALVLIYKLLHAEGGNHMKLAGLIPEIREMLNIAGVSQHLEIYDTVEDAVASF